MLFEGQSGRAGLSILSFAQLKCDQLNSALWFKLNVLLAVSCRPDSPAQLVGEQHKQIPPFHLTGRKEVLFELLGYLNANPLAITYLPTMHLMSQEGN